MGDQLQHREDAIEHFVHHLVQQVAEIEAAVDAAVVAKEIEAGEPGAHLRRFLDRDQQVVHQQEAHLLAHHRGAVATGGELLQDHHQSAVHRFHQRHVRYPAEAIDQIRRYSQRLQQRFDPARFAQAADANPVAIARARQRQLRLVRVEHQLLHLQPLEAVATHLRRHQPALAVQAIRHRGRAAFHQPGPGVLHGHRRVGRPAGAATDLQAMQPPWIGKRRSRRWRGS